MPVRDLLSAASGASTTANYIEDVFSTYLYTGNGNPGVSTQTINNGIDLAGKGGMTWVKCRSTGAQSNVLCDTVRGANNVLRSNSTAANYAATSLINSFNSNGFTLGNDSDTGGWTNQDGYTYCSWTFRKQSKFFNVITYNGTGSAQNINHNLGSVPGMIIVKRTDTTADWQVYSNSLANTEYLVLNSTAAKATGTTRWNSTIPTSSVFTVGTDATVNASGGTYVAYLFAHNAGGFGTTGSDNVISCGSLTTTSGTVSVNLGYEAQYVLVKMSSGTSGWYVFDVMRGMSQTNCYDLNPNTATAEHSFGGQGIIPTATGFDFYSPNFGVSGDTYIYMAIRRPMKVPTDATTVFKPVAYTGNNSTNNITTNFPVDLFITMAYYGAVNNTFDRLRGASKCLATSQVSAEVTDTAQSSFASNTAVILGPDSTGYVNYSDPPGRPYSSYNFSRRPGFFDEVCSPDFINGTPVTHNLGVTPELIFVKTRNSGSNWMGAVNDAGNIRNLSINTTSGGYLPSFVYSSYFNATTIDPTGIRNGAGGSTKGTGVNVVIYLFATCPGVSKVGSFTGTGATQTINCGFTGGARFVMIKRTDSTGDWYAFNSSDGFTSSSSPYNLLNSTAAQTTGNNGCYAASTGFTLTSTANATVNISGASYIFLAIA